VKTVVTHPVIRALIIKLGLARINGTIGTIVAMDCETAEC